MKDYKETGRVEGKDPVTQDVFKLAVFNGQKLDEIDISCTLTSKIDCEQLMARLRIAMYCFER